MTPEGRVRTYAPVSPTQAAFHAASSPGLLPGASPDRHWSAVSDLLDDDVGVVEGGSVGGDVA
jgi:hypothetical protein